MGHFYCNYLTGKKKKDLVLTFAIVMVLHGVNDFLSFEISRLQNLSEDISALPDKDFTYFFCCTVGMLVINIFALVFSLKLAKRNPDTEIILKKE